MSTFQIILLIIFIVSALVGYKIINRVPSLLHTPLMSGMNAFSGITILGCLSATAATGVLGEGNINWLARILGYIAIILAMLNVVGGFGVTHRMLQMFQSQKSIKRGGARIMSASVINYVLAAIGQVNIIPRMDSAKQIPYLIMAGALAILVLIGISMMSKVRLSVAGNLLGSVSMALAIGITLWAFDIFSVIDLWVAMLIGALLGLVLSRKVTMLQMPQLVGLLNGFGGAASMIAGALTLLNPGGDDPFSVITSGLAIFVGSLTLTGSIVAAGKLHQVFTQKPIILTGHRFWALGSLVLGILTVPLFLLPTFQAGGAKTVLILLCVLISGAFGIFFSVRVGGADMPITISLLNSFSGVAGGIAGLAISDPLLVAVGGIVGASGLLLTQIMCRAMNRNLLDILLGKTSANVMQKADKVTADKADESTALAAETDTDLSPSPPTKGKVQSVSMSKTVVEAKTETETITAEAVRVSATVIETKQEETEGADYASWLRDAKRVIIVPGYGMALSQSQHLVKELMDKLEARGAVVDFAIHPVAGRMPGHMNVLLAEVEIPYEKLREMDDINDEFKTADIAIIIGANDVVNPAANTAENTPIYGMPILQVEDTKHLIIMNFDKKPGYAGVDNPLYEADDDQVALLLGDAKDSLKIVLEEL